VSPREATVTASHLNVRQKASASSTIIDTVASGDVIRVMGETESGWALIDHGGKTGFVSKKHIA